jgi:large subunit ribosomal protein L22
MVKYSFGAIDPKTMARAYGKEIDMSPKHAVEISRTIRGMTVENAQKYLIKVVRMEKAVPFKKYGSVGNRKGKMGPGRYPVKAAQNFLKLLTEVSANAELHIDTEPDELRIIHLSSYKGVRINAWYARAHGRSSPKNRERVNVEIVVEKMQESEG